MVPPIDPGEIQIARIHKLSSNERATLQQEDNPS